MPWNRLNGDLFEQLCADLLEILGFSIRHSGVGPDRGMDLLAQKNVDYGLNYSENFIWLVQCKYKSKDVAIYRSQVRNFIVDIPKHGADGYFLITNARLSSTLEEDLYAVNHSKDLRYRALYWDKRILESMIRQNPSIMEKYFDIKERLKRPKHIPKQYSKREPYIPMIIYNLWETTINLNRQGDGKITHKISGLVNRNELTENEFTILSDDELNISDMKCHATDLITKRSLPIRHTLTNPNYKRIAVLFPSPIMSGESFNYKMTYMMPRGFNLIKDYWVFTNKYPSYTIININFPKGYQVISVDESYICTKEGLKIPTTKNMLPKILDKNKKSKITWEIHPDLWMMNTSFYLKWKYKKQ